MELSGWLVTLVAALWAFASPQSAVATVYTVNNTGDGTDVNTADDICEVTAGVGDCTLRAAITQANAFAGPHTINFNIAAKMRCDSFNGKVGQHLGRISGNDDVLGISVSITAVAFEVNLVIVTIIAEIKLSASIWAEIKNNGLPFNNISSHFKFLLNLETLIRLVS
jgi:hypothetical protein